MESGMSRMGRKDNKVFYSIVACVSIFMMNNIFPRKNNPQMLFYDKARVLNITKFTIRRMIFNFFHNISALFCYSSAFIIMGNHSFLKTANARSLSKMANSQPVYCLHRAMPMFSFIPRNALSHIRRITFLRTEFLCNKMTLLNIKLFSTSKTILKQIAFIWRYPSYAS